MWGIIFYSYCYCVWYYISFLLLLCGVYYSIPSMKSVIFYVYFNCVRSNILFLLFIVNTNISTSTLSPSVPSSTSSYPTDHVSMSTNLTTTISPSSRNVTNLTTTTLPATTFHEGKFLSAQHSADLSQIELDWIQRREVVKVGTYCM